MEERYPGSKNAATQAAAESPSGTPPPLPRAQLAPPSVSPTQGSQGAAAAARAPVPLGSLARSAPSVASSPAASAASSQTGVALISVGASFCYSYLQPVLPQANASNLHACTASYLI